jgi:hypothetical protein
VGNSPIDYWDLLGMINLDISNMGWPTGMATKNCYQLSIIKWEDTGNQRTRYRRPLFSRTRTLIQTINPFAGSRFNLLSSGVDVAFGTDSMLNEDLMIKVVMITEKEQRQRQIIKTYCKKCPNDPYKLKETIDKGLLSISRWVVINKIVFQEGIGS